MGSESLPNIGAVAMIQIDGIDVRYARSGSGPGAPIMLTSPWPESIYSFRHVIPRLGANHPLIAVDLPGFGLSGSRPDVMGPQAMGDFVLKLLEHFGLVRPHVIAPDVGALAVLFAE